MAAAKKAEPTLTPTPPAPMVVTPGVAVDQGEVALRCSNCNQLSRWQRAYVTRYAQGGLVCPICGTVGRCDS